MKNRIRNGGSRADDAYLAQTLDAERADLIVVLVDEDDRYLILGLIWLFFSYLNNLSRLREHTPVDATKRAVGFLCRTACGFAHWAVAALINVLRPSRSASCPIPLLQEDGLLRAASFPIGILRCCLLFPGFDVGRRP